MPERKRGEHEKRKNTRPRPNSVEPKKPFTAAPCGYSKGNPNEEDNTGDCNIEPVTILITPLTVARVPIHVTTVRLVTSTTDHPAVFP